jgi:hypothetical protein
VSKDQDKVTMSLSSLDDAAASRLATMETWARRQVGSVSVARTHVARAVGLSEGLLERVRRRRVKGVRAYVAERIQAAYVDQLQLQIRDLEHELFVALARGDGPSGPEAEQARAAIAQARQVIADGMKRERE